MGCHYQFLFNELIFNRIDIDIHKKIRLVITHFNSLTEVASNFQVAITSYQWEHFPPLILNITIASSLTVFEICWWCIIFIQHLWSEIKSEVCYILAWTQWGRAMHICVSKRTIIGSDNGLSPDRRQAIIWTNAGLLLIGPLGTNLSEILIKILTFSFKKMHLKVSSAKQRPFCVGLNLLNVELFRIFCSSCCLHPPPTPKWFRWRSEFRIKLSLQVKQWWYSF